MPRERDPYETHIQDPILTEQGFQTVMFGDECWACGKTSFRRKTRPDKYVWRCECGVEWGTSLTAPEG